MKHLPIKLNPYLLFILLSTSCLLVSCGAYQNTYNNDGIYGDVQEAEGYRKVIVVDEQEYQEYEDNYFLKKLFNFQFKEKLFFGLIKTIIGYFSYKMTNTGYRFFK